MSPILMVSSSSSLSSQNCPIIHITYRIAVYAEYKREKTSQEVQTWFLLNAEPPTDLLPPDRGQPQPGQIPFQPVLLPRHQAHGPRQWLNQSATTPQSRQVTTYQLLWRDMLLPNK